MLIGRIVPKISLRKILSARKFGSSPSILAKKAGLDCDPICVASNGVLVCWHSAKDFPYEHSKPLPREEASLKEGETVLKVQLEEKHKQRFWAKTGPSPTDLQDMFYTNKMEFAPSDEPSRGVKWYVQQLENTLIRLMREEFHLETVTSPHTGVWTAHKNDDEKKLAAIGIHVKRRITSHGLALNCNTDMKWFGNIVPCGIVGKGVTSLSEELEREIKVSEVLEPFCRAFAAQFECEVVRNL